MAQDGQEMLSFPHCEKWKTLFIGGSTTWKMSQGAIECIQRALAQEKKIHVGRVNWWRRYVHLRAMKGSEGFTCDGTRTCYDGTSKTIAAWAGYQKRFYLMRLPLSFGDSCS